ncbi:MULTISPECIES: hypothetical protein [Pseudanabaena]|uniref:YD repeat-containing protein n=2 Tax=Pseudanabaena TaxID=1152 RepID=L8N6X1_9CYAN|nr:MULTISPECIES: hypothetical protein [Pseudanabaena]ELS34854.1 YD repeat-containing protein [Pseudanabaena biceps PCC 7429]MDG3492972.1 hypothetical protein [Pseudanabaena catenata USMAC16]
MSPDVNFLNVSASPLALPVQTSNSLIPTLQSNNSLSMASYAIRTDQTVTINGGGDLDGNPLLANDDALIYAAKGFTFNNVPILPVNRNTNGDPIYDALTGKQVLVDNAVTVASGYTTINANNNPYIGLLPPKVVAPEIMVVLKRKG